MGKRMGLFLRFDIFGKYPLCACDRVAPPHPRRGRALSTKWPTTKASKSMRYRCPPSWGPSMRQSRWQGRAAALCAATAPAASGSAKQAERR
jgi:hypothetical protein